MKLFNSDEEKTKLGEEISNNLKFGRTKPCTHPRCDGNCWPKPKIQKTFAVEKLIVPFLPGLTINGESEGRTEQRHQERLKSIEDCYENGIDPWSYGKLFTGENTKIRRTPKNRFSEEDATRILNIIIESRDRHKLVYNNFRKIQLERRTA